MPSRARKDAVPREGPPALVRSVKETKQCPKGEIGMEDILALAEAIWKGETDTFQYHPLGRPRGMVRLAEGTWFYRGFANTIIRETGEGLFIIDPSAGWDAGKKYEAVRAVTAKALHTAVFTHGHVDHVFGVSRYREEAKARGWALPRIIAHEALPERFKRYRATEAWNGHINLRQFRGGVGEPMFPVNFDFPDITYRDQLDVRVGDICAQLRHARGETDDHTWVFFPDNGLLCTGDLFIYGVPNAGNPQKVQRYAGDWAAALRRMAALEPRILAPGHGFPILGTERVVQALMDTADLLEHLHDQTLELMNRGASLDQVIHAVKAPDHLLRKPYLKPVYDEPEFIVRNIWRFYGGWYDGTPSHLKPAPETAQAEEIARLAGGAHRLAERAMEVAEEGDLRLACHLAEWAFLAAPHDPETRKAASEVFSRRAEAEPSTMAMGVYLSAARRMGGVTGPEARSRTVMDAQQERGRHAEGS